MRGVTVATAYDNTGNRKTGIEAFRWMRRSGRVAEQEKTKLASSSSSSELRMETYHEALRVRANLLFHLVARLECHEGGHLSTGDLI